MQKIHFIGICNQAMHHLAIAVSKKNSFSVTGSDVNINEPFYSHLKANGILSNKAGWFPEKIKREITAIVVGPCVSADNPELMAAKDMGLKIYSYPEFILQQTRSKTRIVITGSQGKSSIVHMILHVLSKLKIDADYITCGENNCNNSAKLSYDARIAIIEGQDYATGIYSQRPDFVDFKPHIAVVSGINFENPKHASREELVQAYKTFIDSMEVQGRLIYFSEDENLYAILKKLRRDIVAFPYSATKHDIRNGLTYVKAYKKEIALSFFGDHQLQNLAAAQLACKQIGVYDQQFFQAFADYETPSGKLELIAETPCRTYVDDANTAYKLKHTLKALRQQFPDRKLIACYQMNDSELTDEQLKSFDNSFKTCDCGFVLLGAQAKTETNTSVLTTIELKKALDKKLQVFDNADELKKEISNCVTADAMVVYMPTLL